MAVDLNVPEQVSSTDGLFQPYLIVFSQNLFVFTAFYFGFGKVGLQPFPQVGYGFLAVCGEEGCYLRAFSTNLFMVRVSSMLW